MEVLQNLDEIIPYGWFTSSMIDTSSVVVETFPRPQYLLNFEIVRYIKIPTTETIESNELNIETNKYYFVDT